MAGQQLNEYKCPCCGGAIAFDSSLQKMKCPYCDTEFEMETLLAYDADLQGDGRDDMQWTAENEQWETDENGLVSYVCRSCGGEIVTDVNTAATACPFCGNPVVVNGKVSGSLKPDYVIPFKLDKEAAKAAYKKHISGKRLLPKVFADENHIDEIKGVYVPFWLFGAKADANMRYKGTTVRSWSDRKYMYTETSYYSIVRAGDLEFENVPVDGSSKMADDMMESLEPFDFSQAVDFQTAYLAGYFADRYDVDRESSIERANARIRTSTESTFSATVTGFATVTPEGGSVRLADARSHYALYPVWLLNTTWNGQKYTFAMNGQSGKMVGDLPLDKAAYRKWLFGLTGAITAGLLLISLIVKLFL